MIKHIDVTLCMQDDYFGYATAPLVFASWFISLGIVGINMVSSDLFLFCLSVGWNLMSILIVLISNIIGVDKPHPECSPWRSGDTPCAESFSVAFVASAGLTARFLCARKVTKRMAFLLSVMAIVSPIAVWYNQFATAEGALTGWGLGLFFGMAWTMFLHAMEI